MGKPDISTRSRVRPTTGWTPSCLGESHAISAHTPKAATATMVAGTSAPVFRGARLHPHDHYLPPPRHAASKRRGPLPPPPPPLSMLTARIMAEAASDELGGGRVLTGEGALLQLSRLFIVRHIFVVRPARRASLSHQRRSRRRPPCVPARAREHRRGWGCRPTGRTRGEVRRRRQHRPRTSAEARRWRRHEAGCRVGQGRRRATGEDRRRWWRREG